MSNGDTSPSLPLKLPPLIVPHRLLETTWSDIWHRFRKGPWADCVKRTILIKCVELSHEQRATMSWNWARPENTRYWTWESSEGTFKVAYSVLDGFQNHVADLSNALGQTRPVQNVILLHGFTASKYFWRFLAPWLASSGPFRVWALDLMGHGLSDAPLDVAYEPMLFVDQIVAFMDAHHIEDAHFIGHSLGGGLSMITSLRHPQRVKSLVLLAPLLYPIELTSFFDWLSCCGKMLPLLGAGAMRALLKHSMGNYDNCDGASVWTTMDVDQYLAPMLKTGAWRAVLLMLKNFDNEKLERLSKHYHRIEQPMLVVYGNCDLTTPCSAGFKLSGECPQAELHILDQTGHLLVEELPLTMQKLIQNFYVKNNIGRSVSS